MDDYSLDITNQLVGACLGFLGTGFLLGYIFAVARGLWPGRKS